MEKKTTLIAKVIQVRRSEPIDDGRRKSRESQIAHGKIEIIKVLGGGEDAIKTEIPVVFSGRRLPPEIFRRGALIQIDGESQALTKRTQIFSINNYALLSPEIIREIQIKTGVELMAHREKAVQLGDFSLRGMIEAGHADKEVQELYTNEIYNIDNLLREGGFQFDIETAWGIEQHFRRRASKRKYTSVSAMLKDNPWILAELDEFRLSDVQRAVQILNPKLEMQVPLYAEMAHHVAMTARQGNSFMPARELAYAKMGRTMDQSGLPANQWVHHLMTLAKTMVDDMPNRALARLTVSGKKDFSEEAAAYYTEAYLAAGKDQAVAKKAGSGAALGVYMAQAYFAEKMASEILAEMLGADPIPCASANFVGLKKEQIVAVKAALEYRVSAIIGYAGTGKTHTVGRLAKILSDNGYRAVFLAPSAIAAQIAAKRLKIGIPYATIHRYARILPENEDLGEFAARASGKEGTEQQTEKFEADVIIIDELTMADLPAMAELLYAIKKAKSKAHLVLVGDPAQLPSIGPSGFFQQIANGAIPADKLPVSKLETIWRAGDEIAVFSQAIRTGKYLDPEENEFKKIRSLAATTANIEKISIELKESGKKLDSVLFLAPTREGRLGTAKLNKLLRPIFLENGTQIGNKDIYVGDPVVSVKNDYCHQEGTGQSWRRKVRHPERKVDIYNGCRGIICKADETGIWVEFSGPEGKITVPYTEKEILSWVEIAYAISVHKAQGSEADVVVFVKAGDRVCRRNMIYTAITRAKEKIILLGDGWQESVAAATLPPFTKFAFRVNAQTERATEQSDINEEKPVVINSGKPTRIKRASM